MKRGLLAILLLFVTMGAYAIDIDSCQTISSSGLYTLNQTVSSSTGCFTITADDVTIDCQQYQISYNTGGGSSHRGILAENVNNISILNCPLTDTSAAGFDTYAIRYSNVTGGTIAHNNITADGTSGAQYNIRLGETTSNINIINNTLYANAPGGLVATVFTIGSTRHVLIENNTATALGGFDVNNYGMYITTHGYNITIKGNTVTSTATGTADRIYGIYAYNNISYSRFIDNTVTVNGDPDEYSGGITSSSPDTDWNNNNHYSNNTVTVSTTVSSLLRTGINPVREEYSQVSGNVVTMSNLGSTAGIDVAVSNHTLIIGNTVISQGSLVTSLRDRSGAYNSTFIGNTIRGAGDWIAAVASSTYNASYYNTTFNESGTPLRIDGPLILNNNSASLGITSTDIEVNATHAFVNTSAKPILNTSGLVYIQNLGFTYYQPLVDYNDNGTFVTCPSSLCSIISQSPNLLLFRVEHFTTFTAQEGDPTAVPEFSTWVMLILLGVTMSGFIAMRKNHH